MNTQATLNFGDITMLVPIFVMTAVVLVLLIADIILKATRGRHSGLNIAEGAGITLGGLAITFAGVVNLWGRLAAADAGALGQLFKADGPIIEIAERDSRLAWSSGALVVDNYSLFVCGLVVLIAVLVCLHLLSHAAATKTYRSELFPLLVTSAIGMMLLGMSRDLLVTFIAIEILSLPLYVMCGLDQKRQASKESSLKYFLLGAFASGFFIYGCALVYGVTGNLNYAASANYITHALEISSLMLAGLALVGVGFAFKLAVVPFHAWAPDVYQGAPTPITGYMAAGVKLAVFAALLRFVVEAVSLMDTHYWRDALVLFAVLSMLAGNLLALHQMSAKRLLAYSAIAHTGYLVVGLAAGTPMLTQSMLTYLVAYSLAALGVFGIISYLAPKGQDDIYLDELHELWKRAPVTSVALTILLLSMGGMPLTAGFIGKFLVFRDAWQAGLTALVIIAVLNSVVSFYYYLRFVMAMFMQPKAPGATSLNLERMPASYIISGIITVGLTLLLGVLPSVLLAIMEHCSL